MGVPGEFVHRSDPADIIPTDWTQLRENRFSISAAWPAAHPFFSPVGDRHDPVLVAETIRQATMLVAHAELGVPVDSQFVLRELSYDADPAALVVDGRSSEVTVDVVLSDLRGSGRNLRSLRTTTVLTRGGTLLATGGGLAGCTSAPAYRRIRHVQLAELGEPVPLTAGVAPRTVGRERDEDVVLGPGIRPNHWRLRVNTAHPTLFRRPNDHVPGMLLLEAARQAAQAIAGPGVPFLPSVLDVSFSRYAELRTPCWIVAERIPDRDPLAVAVRVEGHQDGNPVFGCTLVSPPEAALPPVTASPLPAFERRLAG